MEQYQVVQEGPGPEGVAGGVPPGVEGVGEEGKRRPVPRGHRVPAGRDTNEASHKNVGRLIGRWCG